MQKKILINASNLHGGGGLQVAISFLYELSSLENKLEGISVWASSEVDNGLRKLNASLIRRDDYSVLNTFGLKAFFSKKNNKIKDFDLVFTIFGPNYFRIKADKEIIGFAQPWILNFKNPVSERLSFMARNLLRTKFFLQWLFFKRADHFIVELEHVKHGLISKGINASNISIIYNTVSSLYLSPTQWGDVTIEKQGEQFSLGIVTRDYPHKNLSVLPIVAKLLKNKYKLNVRFYVTLNTKEWSLRDSFFKNYVTTVGALSPEECPLFYQKMDGVIFPSLLECFSATPLEAMVMQKPLFASERAFVKNVCANHAVYFDPLNPESIAFSIAEYFNSNIDRTQQLKSAREHALSFSSAPDRAAKYIEVITKSLNE